MLPFSWLYSQTGLGLRDILPAPGTAPGFLSVHPIELEDPSEFLTPHAVVLTVGIPLKDHTATDLTSAVHDYITRIAGAGAAGVGFGTGLFFDTVPPALVDAARAHGLALFEIPRPVPFLSITGAVQQERTRRAHLAHERLLDAQQRLTASAIEGGLESLLVTASSYLGAAVAVTDNDGRLHGHHDHAGLSAVALGSGQTSSGASQDTMAGTWSLTQLMEKQGERRHLLTVLARHPFSPHDRSVLRHCSGLADLILQRPSYLQAARQRLNTLAMSLLLGIDDSRGDVVPEAFATAVDSEGRIRPVIVQADRSADLRAALARIERRVADRGRQMFALPWGQDATLLFVRGSRTLAGIADDAGVSRHGLRIAVGEPVSWRDIDLDRVERLETSARALSRGQAAGPFEAGSDWLTRDAVREALDHRAAETVDRLTDVDAGTSVLTDTLVTWLRTCSKAVTADRLGVHRHTVRERLNRIEEICEVDLEDPVTRAELLLVVVTRTGRT